MNPLRSIKRLFPARLKNRIKHRLGLMDPTAAGIFEAKPELLAASSDRPEIIDLDGRRLRWPNGNALIHIYEEVFLLHQYAFECDDPKPRIVDLGANIGLSVLYFKDHHPQAEIVALEADPETFDALRQNVGHLPGVTLVNKAAYNRDTDVSFERKASLTDSAVRDDIEPSQATLRVPAIRVGPLLRGRRVAMLKMDIEGAESVVLPDIEPELGNVDRVIFEYHAAVGQPQNLGDLLGVLERAGFLYDIYNPLYVKTYGTPFASSECCHFETLLMVNARRRGVKG